MDHRDLYLRATDVVDWTSPEVLGLARRLASESPNTADTVRRCFEWVRDHIRHSRDSALKPVTCTASSVLREGSGYCYAKSHLLAALLRANGIPAGFCYQRLSRDDDGAPYCLHALNAVWLDEIGWYRLDARGNRPGIDAQCVPPVERLAFSAALVGEVDGRRVFPDPLPVVVDALRRHVDADELFEELPDVGDEIEL